MRKKQTEQATKGLPESPPYKPRKGISVGSKGDDMDSKGRAFAELITSSEMAAFRVVAGTEAKQFSDDIDSPTMLEAMREQAAAVQRDDMKQAEAMLINQATALQSLFARLTERAWGQEHMPNLEGFMRMALRAQNQCRATLETLATIKNPPIIYAKQVNQTTGPQQINNGASGGSGAGANPQGRASEIEQFQLLKADHGERVDTGTAGATIPSHSMLETVGTINRAEVDRGQS